jgi:hypothetical protein
MQHAARAIKQTGLVFQVEIDQTVAIGALTQRTNIIFAVSCTNDLLFFDYRQVESAWEHIAETMVTNRTTKSITGIIITTDPQPAFFQDAADERGDHIF